jgi:hypothetical protein
MPATKKKTVKRKTASKKAMCGYEGGKVKKVVRKTATKSAAKKPIKRATTTKTTKVVKKRRTTKGKSRGASGVGKYIKKYISKVWADARAKGRDPTTAEKSKAFKDGWAEFKKLGK